jgi:methyl-accepting chemotaxis protein
MARDRITPRLALSVGQRIAGGFTVVLALLVALAGVTFQLMAPLDTGAARVEQDNINADAATTVSLQVAEAHARVVQYALSATMADQKAAEDSLTRLGQAIEKTASTSAEGNDSGLTALAGQYRASVDSTFAAVELRRAGIERMQTAGTEIRTITTAIVEALEAETDPDLIRSGARLELSFQAGDAASSRFLASRNPADSNVASNALAAMPGGIEELARLGADNRRIRRFTTALDKPLGVYTAELQHVVAADEKLRQAAAAREAASEAVLAAAVVERDRAAGSQRAAVASMLDSVGSVRELLMIASVAAVGIGLALAALIGRGISRPILLLTTAMQRLAEGDLTLNIPALERRDEIGRMAQALLVFRRNAQEARALQGEVNRVAAMKDRRQEAMDRHTQDFGTSVSGVMASFTISAEGMRKAARGMSDVAESVREHAGGTAALADNSSSRLTSVAAATEEMAASVDEISRQVTAATEVARKAVAQARASQNGMNVLAESTSRIGEVVRLISAIAEQTNLLALNATIEAARAGEAGRGFAVVAGEVKALATQTANATREIGGQIDAVRTATDGSVAAMADVAQIIGQFDEVTTMIAAAIEQQSATTREIAANVQGVTVAGNQTSNAMKRVVGETAEAGVASQQVLEAAGTISLEADRMRSEVDQFLSALRDETGDRRRYERIPGNGATATLAGSKHASITVTVQDISRGGAALACDWEMEAGTEVTVDLPGAGAPVSARVVRTNGREIIIVFRQNPDTLSHVDEAIAALTRQAA